MALHTLEPERATLHGQFSRDLAPVLTVASGDVVRCRMLDVSWGLEARRPDGSPRDTFGPRDNALGRNCRSQSIESRRHRIMTGSQLGSLASLDLPHS